MSGGLRGADCVLELEACYRYDVPAAPSPRYVRWTQLDPGGSGGFFEWSTAIPNGWCQYLRLPSVTASTLAYSYSDDGSTWIPSGSVTVPSPTSCSPTLVVPVITPVGGSFNGAVLVTITTASPGATIYYTLLGQQYSASTPVAYTGPILITQPGNTTIVAFAGRVGATSSQSVQSSFIVTLSTNINVTSRGARLLDSSGTMLTGAVGELPLSSTCSTPAPLCPVRRNGGHWREPSDLGHRWYARCRL